MQEAVEETERLEKKIETREKGNQVTELSHTKQKEM